MKKSIILSALLLAAAGSYAKARPYVLIDDQVTTAFAQKYPDVKFKEWQMENGEDVAVFKNDKRNTFAYFAPDGNWDKTVISVGEPGNLPCRVKYAWEQSAYKNWEVESVARIETPQKNMYCIVVHYADNDEGSEPTPDMAYRKLYFDEWGDFIKSEPLKS